VELTSGCKTLANTITSAIDGSGGRESAREGASPLGSETAHATDAQVAAMAFRWNRRSPVTRKI
jgi:hypothetical protein